MPYWLPGLIGAGHKAFNQEKNIKPRGKVRHQTPSEMEQGMGAEGQYGFPGFMNAMGPQQLALMQQMMMGQSWMTPYLQGRDVIDTEQQSAQTRLNETMAGRGTYRQGPYAQGTKEMDQRYGGVKAQFLAQSQQQAQQQQMAMLEMVLQMLAGERGYEFQGQQADKDRRAGLYQGLGDLGGIGLKSLLDWLTGGGGE